MDENEFIENFASIFDDIEASDLTMDTMFKNLPEWSSLVALGLLAVMGDEYEAEISAKDIENSQTIRDIFNIVQR